MLGLAEKNILSYDFDMVASDPSDANTNSTTLFSDDTDDRSKRSTNPEAAQQEPEVSISKAAAVIEELPGAQISECRPNVPGISDRRTGNFSSGPKKSELRIGESSAFFTYVKATTLKSNVQEIAHVDNHATTQVRVEDMNQACARQRVNDLKTHENQEMFESRSQEDLPSSNSFPDSFSIERSCTPPASVEVSQQKNFREEYYPQGSLYPSNGSRGSKLEPSGMPAQHAYPYYYNSGVVNHVMLPSSAQLYQKNMQDIHSHANSSMIAQYNHLAQCSPHANGMTSFPYYPMNICLQPGQVSTPHSWPSLGSSGSCEVNLSKADRREAALMKFKQKRKDRCFDKKIRYVNRKRLAERRPRVRGQFVRKLSGVDVYLNGQPASADYDEEEEEEEDNHVARDSSLEDA